MDANVSVRCKPSSRPPKREEQPTKTPWAEWFRHGVGELGLAPEEFWRLSLWEWLALVGARAVNAPTRADLEALMRAHPDKES